jgi:hypothetical protein
MLTNKKQKSLSISDYINLCLMQKQKLEIDRLGANIGDTVLITWPGNGSYAHGFDCSKPHKITKIRPNGFVEFDHGAAISLHPDVFKL